MKRFFQNNHDSHRGKDCMKRFCQFFRVHAIKQLVFKRE